MNQGLITLIINGVFGFFILMGFLFGIKRGFSKATLRFIYITGIAFIMYFAAPHLSKLLLNMDISFITTINIESGGTTQSYTTINSAISGFLQSNQQVQDFVVANPSFTTLVQQLPTIVTNVVIFILGFWILKTLSWPIYAIGARRYNKKSEDGSKPNRRRLLGGVMGMAQGVVIALVVFMPIAGLSSTLNTPALSGGTLLGQMIPPEVAEYLPSYEKSIIGKIGGIGNLDTMMFDGLTTITVKNPDTGKVTKIVPRKDINTILEMANDIEALITMIEGIQDGTVNEIDWDLVETIIDKVFDLRTLELLVEEYLPYIGSEAINNPQNGVSGFVDGTPASSDFDELFAKLTQNLDETTLKNLKSDIMAIVNIGKALNTHGIEELIFKVIREEITSENMLEQGLAIFATNRQLSNDITLAIVGSHSIRTLMPEAINVAIGYIEHAINQNRPVEDFAPITRIDVESIDWNEEAEYFTDILHKLMIVANSIDIFNMDSVDTLEVLDSLQITELGNILNIIRETQLFGDIYTSLIEAVFTLPEIVDAVGEYIDLGELINILNTTDWAEEFRLIEDIINLYRAIELGNNVLADDIRYVISNLDSPLLDLFLEGVVRAAFIEGFGEDIGQFVDDEFVFHPEFEWLQDLSLVHISSNADFFAQVFDLILNMEGGIESISNEKIDSLAAAIKAIETNIEDPVELAKFKNFFNNMIHYTLNKFSTELTWASSLNIDDFIGQIDMIAELFKLVIAVGDNSFLDYTPEQVQSLIESIGDLNNVSPELTEVLQGFYDDLMGGEDAPLYVPIDFSTVDWEQEGELIGNIINLYLHSENNDGEFSMDIAHDLIQSMSGSTIAESFLEVILDEMIIGDEETPEWLSDVEVEWISENADLTVELLELFMWPEDIAEEGVPQEKIDALNNAIQNATIVSSEFEDALSYIQDFVNSLTPSTP